MAKILTAKDVQIDNVVFVINKDPLQTIRIVVRYTNIFQDIDKELIFERKEYNLSIDDLPIKFVDNMKGLIKYFTDKQKQELGL